MNGLAISDYGLLSDCRTAALVSRSGSVDWLCWPRFDGPAVFARILDSDGGHFAIQPAGDFQASRAYAAQTMVLETTFRAQAGTAVLTDAMALGSLTCTASCSGPRSGWLTSWVNQAFSHIGLVNAAWAIAQARERAAGQGQTPAPGSGTTQEHGSRPVSALHSLWPSGWPGRASPGRDQPAAHRA